MVGPGFAAGLPGVDGVAIQRGQRGEEDWGAQERPKRGVVECAERAHGGQDAAAGEEQAHQQFLGEDGRQEGALAVGGVGAGLERLVMAAIVSLP